MDSIQLPDEIYTINVGYLTTPAPMDKLEKLIEGIWEFSHEDSDTFLHPWIEYRDTNADVYPKALLKLINLGIAFVYEYAATTDYSYYAYNFPTPESKQNYAFFNSSGRRKKLPKLSKKKLRELAEQSEVNLFLHLLGIPDANSQT